MDGAVLTNTFPWSFICRLHGIPFTRVFLRRLELFSVCFVLLFFWYSLNFAPLNVNIDQQHRRQHHLGGFQKCNTLGSTPDLLNQRLYFQNISTQFLCTLTFWKHDVETSEFHFPQAFRMCLFKPGWWTRSVFPKWNLRVGVARKMAYSLSVYCCQKLP